MLEGKDQQLAELMTRLQKQAETLHQQLIQTDTLKIEALSGQERLANQISDNLKKDSIVQNLTCENLRLSNRVSVLDS